MKRRYLSLLLAVFLAAAVLCVPALAVVDKSDSFYVADYANVLSADTESTIINDNGALEKQCNGAQIVVVTVDYLDGMNEGLRVVLVTSGAIGVGVGKLGLPGRPEDTAGKQAAATVGQCELMFMDGLPVAQRSVLLLFFIEDFSIEEIAEITGAQLGTVKSRLHYAKIALKHGSVRSRFWIRFSR